VNDGQTFGKDYSLKVLCITNFPEKAQNKNKVGIKTTFSLMIENTGSKKPFINSTFV